MSLNIKARLAIVNKTQAELIEELEKIGYKVSKTEMSNFVNAVRCTKKAKIIITESEKIIKKWEKKFNKI